MDINMFILYFFIYSVLGWAWEEVFCSISEKKLVYRGFLYGPYCPIYGFGVTAVLMMILPFQNNLWALFIFSMIICTVIEYVTATILEALFHTTWWDYHNWPLNVKGRICLPISIFWGFACIIIVRFLHPLVTEFADWILSWGGWIIPALIVVLMLIDTIKSVTSMLSFQKALAEFNEKLNAQANELKASVKERAKEFEEGLLKKQENVDMKIAEIEAKRKQDKELAASMRKLKFNERRMLKSFPKMKVKRAAPFKNLNKSLLRVDKLKRK
ncbi:TPA: hypothetical protein REB65_001677 [Listeria monocytogenes]|nr:hypothetical protein [Listeria monocytogenes]